MSGAQPALWALGPQQDESASLTIRLKADLPENRFSIAVTNHSQGRRTSRTRHVQVPEGGDLGDLGRVAKSVIERWLWDPTFAAPVALLLAITEYYGEN